MPHYHFQAIDEQGLRIEGRRHADSTEELVRLLAGENLRAIEFSQGFQFSFSKKHHRVSPEELLFFLDEFLSLLRAGMEITESLLTLSRSGGPLSLPAKNLVEDLRQGHGLEGAFQRQRHLFDEFFLSAVATAERTGNLTPPLERYRVHLKRRIALARSFKSALTYPAFLGVALILIMAFLVFFVLPNFLEIYRDMKVELPWPTQVMLFLVHKAHFLAFGTALVGLLAYGALKALLRSPKMRLRLDGALLRLPLLGELLLLRAQASFAGSLASLLKAGTHLLEAMKIATTSLGNERLKNLCTSARNDLQGGLSLAESLAKAKLFNAGSLALIRAGEKTGELGEVFEEIARHGTELLEYRSKRISSLIEPLLLLATGILVGGAILSIYLPIFSMAEVIG